MSDFFEIAYAAASGRLCLFTGTGFSKSVTGNKIPSWQELLESLCEFTDHEEELKSCLFPDNGNNPLSLDESAQVISISMNKTNIHNEIAKKIGKIKLKGSNKAITEFFSNNQCKIITTNYDKLIEQLAGESNCLSISRGLPIPHYTERIEVYHVHGSIDSPHNMIVTSNNYYRFNKLSYFSKKLSTILYENTIVILGYSFSDSNLKSIINDYRRYSKTQTSALNIFFVSRSKVEQPIKDFYGHTYGIRVIDRMEIKEFFEELNLTVPEAKKTIKKSQENIRKVLFNGSFYKDKYLKIENSFYEIISSIRAIGGSIDDPIVVKILGRIIESKTNLTHEQNAWEQYVHLANWLIYLATFLELKNTSIEQTYLDAVYRSMNTMSKNLIIGYSWHAYKAWRSGWLRITPKNRRMINRYITKNTKDNDAINIVTRMV